MSNMTVTNDSNHPCESVQSPLKATAKSTKPPSVKPTLKKPLRRRRKLTSEVWNYFDIVEKEKKNHTDLDPDNPANENEEEVSDGEPERCKCKKCGAMYFCDSKYGTRNLKRHLVSCLKNNYRPMDIGQMLMAKNRALQLAKFNPDRFRELVVHAVIKHDLPLTFVEYEGVRNIFTYLNPDAISFSRRNVRTAILSLHQKEFHTLCRSLSSLSGRICLTSDLWTSIATDGYLSLTAHFIDHNWVLHKRLLNFSYMAPPHSGIALKEKVYGLLTKWGIENKLFSFTLDNASSNDVLVDLLKNHPNLNNALVDEGNNFHIRCCAHILNLVVQMGLKEIDVVVDKIRECVKYMKGSQARKHKLMECCAQYSLDTKRGLRQDVPTRWNSTYLMLASAIYFRRAFCQLQLSDSNFKHCPSQEEWGRAEKICEFLKVFYDVTCIFSGSKYPTSNLYFPKVCAIQYLLNKEIKSTDPFMSKMAAQMMVKFEKYWSEHCVILAIAVIFDHRYKFQFVEYSSNKLYGEFSNESFTETSRIREKLYSLFSAYDAKVSTDTNDCLNVGVAYGEENQGEFLKDFDAFQSCNFACTAQKTQLEQYLNEPGLPRNEQVDILTYWRAHQYRYPELAAVARDILSISISTVASEFAFSVGGRVLDKYRSALRPEIVEALICSRDWLFEGQDIEELKLDDVLEDIMNLNLVDKGEAGSMECSSTGTVIDV